MGMKDQALSLRGAVFVCSLSEKVTLSCPYYYDKLKKSKDLIGPSLPLVSVCSNMSLLVPVHTSCMPMFFFTYRCVCATFVLQRRKMETRLSKQVFNMLSGPSSLPSKHTYTVWHTDTGWHKLQPQWDQTGDRVHKRMFSVRGQRQG